MPATETVDPTKNVLDLVEAAVLRQDDLRKAVEACLKDAVHRQDDLRNGAIEAARVLVDARMEHLLTLITGNDKRYEQRFDASQKALELGLSNARQAVDTAMTAQEKAIGAALAAQERAVLKAELATEKRFEGVNEFRGALDLQQRTLIPRSEVDVLVRGLEEKISQLTKTSDQQQNAIVAAVAQSNAAFASMNAERRGVRGGWGYAVGAVGFVLSIGALIAMFANFSRSSVPVSPQVIYTPAPPGTQLPSLPPTTVPR